MAEALFLKYSREAGLNVAVDSCGLLIDEMRPYVAEITKTLLRQKNEKSKRITPYLISWADHIVIVADNVLLSDLFPKNKTEVWRVSDASEHDFLAVARIIDEIDIK